MKATAWSVEDDPVTFSAMLPNLLETGTAAAITEVLESSLSAHASQEALLLDSAGTPGHEQGKANA